MQQKTKRLHTVLGGYKQENTAKLVWLHWELGHRREESINLNADLLVDWDISAPHYSTQVQHQKHIAPFKTKLQCWAFVTAPPRKLYALVVVETSMHVSMSIENQNYTTSRRPPTCGTLLCCAIATPPTTLCSVTTRSGPLATARSKDNRLKYNWRYHSPDDRRVLQHPKKTSVTQKHIIYNIKNIQVQHAKKLKQQLDSGRKIPTQHYVSCNIYYKICKNYSFNIGY